MRKRQVKQTSICWVFTLYHALQTEQELHTFIIILVFGLNYLGLRMAI